MKNYLDVLRTRGVARLLASQLTARFPAGMLSLAILIHIEQLYRSYTAAGVVLAALSIGQAVSGPVAGRLMGRLGMRPVLTVATILTAADLLVLALVPLPLWAVSLVAGFAGLVIPPITPAVRTIYPKVVNSAQLQPLFSLDASLQEIIWVVGPVAATFVAFAFSPPAGIVLCSIILALGAAWFITAPAVGSVRIPPSRHRLGRVLRIRIVLLMTALGFLLIGSAAAVEAATVALFGHERPETGILLAVYSVGSFVGGFALGHRSLTPVRLVLRMGIVAAGLVMALFAQEAWWLGVSYFVSGLGIAPTLSGSFAAVSSQLRFSETAESYGWMGTGQLIGAAAGSAAAGVAIDLHGGVGALWVGAGLGVLGVLLLALFLRAIPDLRGRDARPRTDTIPLTLPS